VVRLNDASSEFKPRTGRSRQHNSDNNTNSHRRLEPRLKVSTTTVKEKHRMVVKVEGMVWNDLDFQQHVWAV
jgi:hypothetical protein